MRNRKNLISKYFKKLGYFLLIFAFLFLSCTNVLPHIKASSNEYIKFYKQDNVFINNFVSYVESSNNIEIPFGSLDGGLYMLTITPISSRLNWKVYKSDGTYVEQLPNQSNDFIIILQCDYTNSMYWNVYNINGNIGNIDYIVFENLTTQAVRFTFTNYMGGTTINKVFNIDIGSIGTTIENFYILDFLNLFFVSDYVSFNYNQASNIPLSNNYYLFSQLNDFMIGQKGHVYFKDKITLDIDNYYYNTTSLYTGNLGMGLYFLYNYYGSYVSNIVANEYTTPSKQFIGLLYAIINVPILYLQSIFSFQLFGIKFYIIFFGFLALALIIFALAKIIGISRR